MTLAKHGETLIGSYAGPDGKLVAAMLMNDELRDATFDDAGKWIAEKGGMRPNRIEGLLIFLHCFAMFERSDKLWLEHFDSRCAWFQDFDYGEQDFGTRAAKFVARAVRRVSIT